MTEEQKASIQYAAEWLFRSEDISNRKHAERLRALLAAGASEGQAEPVMWVILDKDRDLIAQSMTPVKGLDWEPLFRAATPASSVADAAGALYTMDQMRDYAESFHKSRIEAGLGEEGNVTNAFVKACHEHDIPVGRAVQIFASFASRLKGKT